MTVIALHRKILGNRYFIQGLKSHHIIGQEYPGTIISFALVKDHRLGFGKVKLAVCSISHHFIQGKNYPGPLPCRNIPVNSKQAEEPGSKFSCPTLLNSNKTHERQCTGRHSFSRINEKCQGIKPGDIHAAPVISKYPDPPVSIVRRAIVELKGSGATVGSGGAGDLIVPLGSARWMGIFKFTFPQVGHSHNPLVVKGKIRSLGKKPGFLCL